MNAGDRDTSIAAITAHGREHSRLSVLFREMIARQFGITAADGECVDYLMDVGVATAGDLVRLTGLTAGAVTGVIRRLTRAGLVTAEPDVRDRRRLVIRPVMEEIEKGLPFYASYIDAVKARVYAHYSCDELALIADYHRRMSVVLTDEIAQMRRDMSAGAESP
jgi:DNA-binding MarR family transcriptional regulator